MSAQTFGGLSLWRSISAASINGPASCGCATSQSRTHADSRKLHCSRLRCAGVSGRPRLAGGLVLAGVCMTCVLAEVGEQSIGLFDGIQLAGPTIRGKDSSDGLSQGWVAALFNVSMSSNDVAALNNVAAHLTNRSGDRSLGLGQAVTVECPQLAVISNGPGNLLVAADLDRVSVAVALERINSALDFTHDGFLGLVNDGFQGGFSGIPAIEGPSLVQAIPASTSSLEGILNREGIADEARTAVCVAVDLLQFRQSLTEHQTDLSGQSLDRFGTVGLADEHDVSPDLLDRTALSMVINVKQQLQAVKRIVVKHQTVTHWGVA